ncbi:MAG: hypothetical protein Q7J54_02345 [Candidatus Woesearchaeota archaeon]|nr:hypothetical protein [Candidatus Woesearchaeota archaeon]
MKSLEKRIGDISGVGRGIHNFFSNLSEDVKKRIIAGTFLLSAIGFAIGCGGGGGGGSSGNGGGGGSETSVSAFVKAEEGATLQMEDYGLTIPPGALKYDTTAEIGKSTYIFPTVEGVDATSDVLYVDLNNSSLNSEIYITLPFSQSSSKTKSKTLESLSTQDFLDSLVGIIYNRNSDTFSMDNMTLDPVKDLMTISYSYNQAMDRIECSTASIPNLVQTANLDTNNFTQTDLDSADPVCLLIHGFTDSTLRAFGTDSDTTTLRSYLKSIYGGRIWAFDYPSGKNARTNVATLEGKVNALNPKFEFDIVAHSMGGVLARDYARRNQSRVRKLAALGAPNEGVPAGAYENAFNQRMHGIVAFLAAITPPWSPGAKDLLEGSSYLLNDLNTNIGGISAKYCTVAGNSDSWWIAGDDDGLVPVSSVHIDDGSPIQRETPESIESYTKDGTNHGDLVAQSGGCFDWVINFLNASTIISGEGKILFTSNRDGDYEIHKVNSDGSELEQLTNNSVGDGGAVWSPDYTQIAYASEEENPLTLELYVMNVDGSNKTRLTYDAVSGVRDNVPGGWSPDGKKIVYFSGVEGNCDLRIIDAGTKSITTIVSAAIYPDTIYPSQPTWSPTEDKIACVLRQYDKIDIWTMDSRGSYWRKLTFSNSTDEVNESPDFSPDGTEIMFHSSRNGIQAMYRMNSSDGSNVQRITPLVGCYNPRYSPDGSQVVFYASWELGDESDIYTTRYTTNLDELPTIHRITTDLATDELPDW